VLHQQERCVRVLVMSVPHGSTNERPTFTNELPSSTAPPSTCTEHAAVMSDKPDSVKRAIVILERQQLLAAQERRLAAEQRSHAGHERANR
jgi:hypothetical protein